jgi:hypothetical protein
MQEDTKGKIVELESLVNEMASNSSVVMMSLRSPMIKCEADRQSFHSVNSCLSHVFLQVHDGAPHFLTRYWLVMFVFDKHQLMKAFFPPCSKVVPSQQASWHEATPCGFPSG